MKLLRFLLSALAILFLLSGYLLSQYETIFLGAPSKWAASMDVPQIRLLSALLLVLAIVFAIVPEKENGAA